MSRTPQQPQLTQIDNSKMLLETLKTLQNYILYIFHIVVSKVPYLDKSNILSLLAVY